MDKKFIVTIGAAALLQTCSLYASETLESNKKETFQNGSGETVNFSSRELGVVGPLGITTSYNSDFGFIFGANFSTYINSFNALALELEGGENIYRLNGTWGIALSERNRLKFSLERLADKDDYDFASGTESEWIGQNAVGASYQYIIDQGWLQALELNAYGAKAESKDFDDELFYDEIGDPLINQRRIAGGKTLGTSLEVTVAPTEATRTEFALHYDSVNYDMKYSKQDYNELDGDDPSTKGFGFSSNIEHIFSESLKLDLGADILSTDHTYSAEVSWLMPVESGSQLEFSLLGSYLNSQTTGDDNSQVGLQLSYQWDTGATSDFSGYDGFGSSSIQSLKTWTQDAAVRMPEVMAVVDEAVFSAIPVLNSEIPDIDRAKNTPINFSVAPYFSNAGPLSSGLVFTAKGLPDTLTMNPDGTLSGNTPDVITTQTYTITAIAQNQYGFKQEDIFDLKVTTEVAPPVALPIPPQSFVEFTANQLDLSVYFSDPNVAANETNSAAKSDHKTENQELAEDHRFTYALTSKPDGWDTPLSVNAETGILNAIAPTYSITGSNQYNIEVTATNYAGTATNSFIVTIENDGFAITQSGPIPRQIPTEEVELTHSNSINLNDYFNNTSNSKTIYTLANTSALGNNIRVDEAGYIVGTVRSVGANTDVTIGVYASSLNSTISPATAEIQYSIAAIPTSSLIPVQTELENSSFTFNVTEVNNGDFQPKMPGNLNYTLTNAPEGWTINDAGIIKGMIPGYNSAGMPANKTLEITVNATNNLNPSLSAEAQVLTIEVTQAVVLLNEAYYKQVKYQQVANGTLYGEKGQNARLNLNQLFYTEGGYQLAYSVIDLSQLNKIGLDLSPNGFVVGQARAENNISNLSIAFSAYQVENPLNSVNNILYFTVAASVNSSNNLDDQIVSANSNFEYDAATAAGFTPVNTAGNIQVEYTMTGNPNGLQIDADTGVISGIPSEVGAYDITVTSTNVLSDTVGENIAHSESFTLVVTP